MGISKRSYGFYNNAEVFAYTLRNNNLEAEIITYGGIITKLCYKGTDVVLGRDGLEEYIDNSGYYGAIIGRNSNRIENSEFELNGKIYSLFKNDGSNNLHGGKVGFDKKVWKSEVIDGDEPGLILSLVSPDMEEGFPGEVKVKVTYILTNDNAIKIHYEAEADKDTVINMTNHSYFNLNGHNSGNIDGHKLWLNSRFYTPNNENCIPTGEIVSVNNTPFDFSTDETLGERFLSNAEQIKMFGGFDHNFALSGTGYRLSGVLVGDKTDIKMEMYTDREAVQIYTTNSSDSRVCKDGAVYRLHQAVCLETQAFPNNLKHSHFPSSILKKGEKYDTVTTFKFI